jgi:hypothetical protein
MKAILAVLCLAVLVAVAQAAVSTLKVNENGELTGFELRNATALEKYTSAGASCTLSFGTSGISSVENAASCPNDQVCLADGGNNTFSCFDCDSSCDCDADSFCLLSSEFLEYGVCVSYKDLLGKTCNQNVGPFSLAQANTTSIAACTVGQNTGANTCNSTDPDLININDAIEYNVQIVQAARYCGIFAIGVGTGPLATNANELNTFYPNDAIGTYAWSGTLTCLDGKCRQCNAYSTNECGGSCSPACTGSTDENKNLFCGSDHSVSYRPRAKAANPLGLKSSASSTAAGAAVVAIGAAAALLL